MNRDASATRTVRSADGTPLAWGCSGTGPPLLLVDGAFRTRGCPPRRELVTALAASRTVVDYDRRGRGASGCARPYDAASEIDDLAALVGVAGDLDDAGSTGVVVVGVGSGACVALEAAAAGVPMGSLVVYEPPYLAEAVGLVALLRARLAIERLLADPTAAGRSADAVCRYLRVTGFAEAHLPLARRTPWWPQLEALAPTLLLDVAQIGDGRVPTTLAHVAVPTLVLDGAASAPTLRTATAAVARAVPGARARTLPGQTHDVDPDVLAAAVEAWVP